MLTWPNNPHFLCAQISHLCIFTHCFGKQENDRFGVERRDCEWPVAMLLLWFIDLFMRSALSTIQVKNNEFYLPPFWARNENNKMSECATRFDDDGQVSKCWTSVEQFKLKILKGKRNNKYGKWKFVLDECWAKVCGKRNVTVRGKREIPFTKLLSNM